MEYYQSILLLLSFIWACIHIFTSNILGRRKSLPPGPYPFPIIGNLFELGNKPHRALANLSKIYGPIMTLKLGSITTIVISSPKFAKEALQKHDQAFSSRSIPDSFTILNHHKHSMVWLPATTHWRNLRKISATQMFTLQKLVLTHDLRREKVQELLDYVQENCKNGQAIDIGRAALTTVLNLLTNTFFSIDFASYTSNMSKEFNELVFRIMEIGGRPNLADYFPIIRSIDPQGARRQMKIHFDRLLEIFDRIINERMQLLSASSNTSKECRDVLDSLLILAQESDSQFTILHIKCLLIDLLVAGIDTTVSTVEWAMTELLHNPEKLAKAKNELKEVEGLIQESEISKFPYLQAIVKEILRLHPPAPMLVPHKAECEVEIGGFKVPKNAKILVNVWAIGRDESIWQNPENFEPERFLESKIDVKGRDFELIPFGAGRRICPGLPLAHRMVHLMLASLIQSFDWKPADDDIDKNENFGLTLHKSKPLRAIPYHRN